MEEGSHFSEVANGQIGKSFFQFLISPQDGDQLKEDQINVFLPQMAPTIMGVSRTKIRKQDKVLHTVSCLVVILKISDSKSMIKMLHLL